VTDLPSPGPSPATAIAEPNAMANAPTTGKQLRIEMLDLPFVVDGPARNDIHVPHRECRDRYVHLGCAAHGEHLVTCGLPVARFVPGFALQHDRLPVPMPRHPETGQCLAQHRRVERRLAPAFAAVGGY